MPHRPLNTIALLFPLLLLAGATRLLAAPVASVGYSVTSSWQSGFQASVTITNTGTAAIGNWTLQFTMPYAIISIWNAHVVSHAGNAYAVAGDSWDTRDCGRRLGEFRLYRRRL